MTDTADLTPHQKYAMFGRRILDVFSEDLTDIDGGTIHDIAVDCGVLVKHTVTQPCGPEDVCRCRDYEGSDEDDKFVNPVDCYRKVPETIAAFTPTGDTK